jgi:hypothetical protein
MAKKASKKKASKKVAKKASKKITKKAAKRPVGTSAAKKSAKKTVKKATKKKASRTVMYSSAGKKLYAKRDAEGQFTDIQTYARAHAADIRQNSQHEAREEGSSQSQPDASPGGM